MPSTCFFQSHANELSINTSVSPLVGHSLFGGPSEVSPAITNMYHKGVENLLKTCLKALDSAALIDNDVVSFVSFFLYPEALALWGAQPFFSFLAFDSL